MGHCGSSQASARESAMSPIPIPSPELVSMHTVPSSFMAKQAHMNDRLSQTSQISQQSSQASSTTSSLGLARPVIPTRNRVSARLSHSGSCRGSRRSPAWAGKQIPGPNCPVLGRRPCEADPLHYGRSPSTRSSAASTTDEAPRLPRLSEQASPALAALKSQDEWERADEEDIASERLSL
eukprot:TRINITY_DN30768_c0_g1_i1.p1 TRINITY_DN30768_c0_g1~~TRINITY_DN30768_c0_g1_i1.p1  ORF type:complete len:180 (+),score=22.73 TRINITY_DN30768_c0_g1_i1:159-698(+)